MDTKVIIETAQQAADGVAQLQLWSSIIIGLVAIGVPAAFAWMDRRSKRSDAQLRARSFALTHLDVLENILDSLKVHIAANPRGKTIVDHRAMETGLIAFRDSKIPVAELYQLDTAAASVQTAFANAQKALSYWHRRATHATQKKNIVLMDADQGILMWNAHDALEEGIQQIREMLS